MATSTQRPNAIERKPLTVERLREFLHYESEMGEWTRRVKSVRGIGKPGDKAGYRRSNGRLIIRIDGRNYRAARLAFLYMLDRWPAAEVDHKDGNPANDRWSNLREASPAQNRWNMKRHRDNASGFKGATWDKRQRKWKAQIMAHGRKLAIGSFDSAEAAHEAYKAKALELFGEFARLE
jgi:hypothetical protein